MWQTFGKRREKSVRVFIYVYVKISDICLNWNFSFLINKRKLKKIWKDWLHLLCGPRSHTSTARTNVSHLILIEKVWYNSEIIGVAVPLRRVCSLTQRNNIYIYGWQIASYGHWLIFPRMSQLHAYKYIHTYKYIHWWWNDTFAQCAHWVDSTLYLSFVVKEPKQQIQITSTFSNTKWHSVTSRLRRKLAIEIREWHAFYWNRKCLMPFVVNRILRDGKCGDTFYCGSDPITI